MRSWVRFEHCFVAAALALLAPPAIAATDTEVVTAPSDQCLTVASAKLAQWSQTPLLIRETKTYADNSTRIAETIFTPDRAYAHYVGQPWNTISAAAAPERSVKSADLAAKAMRLESCQLAGPAGGRGSKTYTFTYLADKDGTRSTGQMVISDSTGLPLEQEIVFNAVHPKSSLPIKITAAFIYGDAAKLPRDAALAEIDQRERQQREIRDVQNRGGFYGH